jgi:hypothetical protein
MGKDGIIAEHPTLKVKYLDPEMARLALELKHKLEAEREEHSREHVLESHVDGEETSDPQTSAEEAGMTSQVLTKLKPQ